MRKRDENKKETSYLQSSKDIKKGRSKMHYQFLDMNKLFGRCSLSNCQHVLERPRMQFCNQTRIVKAMRHDIKEFGKKAALPHIPIKNNSLSIQYMTYRKESKTNMIPITSLLAFHFNQFWETLGTH